ncbi:MAG TPA: 2-oxoglutarate dehydrogenase complex dihydrolipoyllysine-residue succinyltransferase [Gammaproteobacteria bacterium]|nr:2-oxoglutarate dehydrogenase complex dihydrolipoyllysine-residue succinyltransferase [Gammaproteobacteria bacterium]
MSSEIKVPVLPESVSDATVGKWHKNPGERVTRDENLVDIETDKVVLEVVAPADGILEEIVKASGETVGAQEVIAKFKSIKADAKASKKSSAQEEKPKEINQEKKMETTSKPKKEEVQASPSVRRLIAEHDLDVDKISGSGKKGAITKKDVEQAIHSESGNGSQTQHQLKTFTVNAEERSEKRVPMSRLRAKIAERLLSAQQNAAILTTFNEVNMKPIMDLRTKYKESFEKAHGIKLGFMPFFVKAVIEALKRFPAVNASIDDKDIIYHGYFDIGVAVSTERGLVVPVLKNADLLSMAHIEETIAQLGKKARDGQLSIEEMTGGTFTISNGGIFGSLLSTPILNPPQTGILGMHKIEERPIVENGEIVIRPMMYVALSYDHRLIDGRESVQFLVTIKNLLEDPARMLLEV